MKSIFVLFAAFFAFACAGSEYWAAMQNRMNGMDGTGMNEQGMNGNGMMYDQNGMMYRMNGNNRMMMPTTTSTPLRGKRGSGYYDQRPANGNMAMPMNGNMPMPSYDDGQMYTMPYYYDPQQQQRMQMGMPPMNRNNNQM